MSLHFKYLVIIHSAHIQLFPNLSWYLMVVLELTHSTILLPIVIIISIHYTVFLALYHKIDFKLDDFVQI